MPVGLGGRAVAQPQDVSQFYGQRFDPTQIDTDLCCDNQQNIPAGSDIGPSFQPLGLSPIWVEDQLHQKQATIYFTLCSRR